MFLELETTTPTPDLALIKALARAHRWRTLLLSGEAHSIDELARRYGLDRGHTGLTLKLTFLSPNTARAILAGEQPSGSRLSDVFCAEIPSAWSEQDATLSNLASQDAQRL